MLGSGCEISRAREFPNRRARHDRKRVRPGRSARSSGARSRRRARRMKSRQGRTMKVRAVIFDLDETLIEEESSNDASALAACEIAVSRHGVDRATLLAAMRLRSRELW